MAIGSGIALGAVIGWAMAGLLRDGASLSGGPDGAGADLEPDLRVPSGQPVTVARPGRDLTDFRNGVGVRCSYHTRWRLSGSWCCPRRRPPRRNVGVTSRS